VVVDGKAAAGFLVLHVCCFVIYWWCSRRGGALLEKRQLGRTGIRVSLLGFGGIPIMRVTPDEATATIGEAVRRGVDFFDTARGYGDSERKIGMALESIGATVVVASKSPKRDKAGMLEDFDISLKDLRLDTIDLYQIHCVNREQDFVELMSEDGAYRALEELRDAGRVRYIGLTSHNLDILKSGVLSGKFDTVQVLYNFIEHEASQEVIPSAVEADVGIIAMKPLAGGCIKHYDIALRYVLAAPDVVSIPGMATPDEVIRNVEAASDLRRLTAAEMKTVDEVRAELAGYYCRRCDYCQPCPQDIPISFALHIPSIRKRVGDVMMKRDIYRRMFEKIRQCEECGHCEERCPFELPVRDLIKESREILAEVLG
jgi:predicted aldo/keto reductase-like oxidoreductase